jgi:N-acetyl-anhydromuramyl-L-alanine amidase AmpD
MEKVEDSVVEVVKQLPAMLVQFGALGVGGWIAAGVLLLLIGVGAFFLTKWLKDRAQEKSDRENEDRKNKAEAGIPKEASDLERGSREGMAWLREQVAKRMEQELEKKITRVKVQAPLQGAFKTPTGWPKGAIVHFTAGRDVTNEAEATAALKDMASRGISAMLIGTDGRLYAPENLGPKDCHSHAGESVWKGVERVSRVCLGIEIACAGKLDENRKSWFGVTYPEEKTRVAPAPNENISPGIYHRFTPEQERSLLDILAWHLRFNPEFDVDWIAGHDEVAPARKDDPGASLSVTMPGLRKTLATLFPEGVRS